MTDVQGTAYSLKERVTLYADPISAAPGAWVPTRGTLVRLASGRRGIVTRIWCTHKDTPWVTCEEPDGRLFTAQVTECFPVPPDTQDHGAGIAVKDHAWPRGTAVLILRGAHTGQVGMIDHGIDEGYAVLVPGYVVPVPYYTYALQKLDLPEGR